VEETEYPKKTIDLLQVIDKPQSLGVWSREYSKCDAFLRRSSVFDKSFTANYIMPRNGNTGFYFYTHHGFIGSIRIVAYKSRENKSF
jgi:hypothetical protein